MATNRAKPMRVVMLVDRLGPPGGEGGAEALLVGIATHLPSDRAEVTVCTTRHARGHLVDALDRAGVTRVDLARRSRLDVIAFRHLIDLLRSQRVDVLHAHMFGSSFWGAVIGRVCHVPIIVAHEHGQAFASPMRRMVTRRVIGRLSTAYVGGARADVNRMVAIEGVPTEKVVLIPGAYIPRPAHAPLDLHAELGLPADAAIVGTVAELRPEKAVEVLIVAFERVASALPNAHLVIVGDGPRRTQLEHLVSELRLEERVRFAGYRHDIDAVIAGFDVAALSSEREGTSLVALECIFNGVPLISTRVGGPSEYLEDGVSAFLVEPRDVAAMSERIQRLLTNPALRASFAANARRNAGQLTVDALAEGYATFYERLLEGASPEAAWPTS